MKSFLVIIFLTVLFLGCNQTKSNSNLKSESVTLQSLNPADTSTNWYTGLIEEGGTNTYFVLNWESKSRESYLILNREELYIKAGQILKVQGDLIQKTRWSGTIRIKKIENKNK